MGAAARAERGIEEWEAGAGAREGAALKGKEVHTSTRSPRVLSRLMSNSSRVPFSSPLSPSSVLSLVCPAPIFLL